MKKLLVCLLCLQITVLPAICIEYDFSDEAQAEFDRQQAVKTMPVNNTNDYSRRRYRTEIKNPDKNSSNTLWEPSPAEPDNIQPAQNQNYLPFYQTPDEQIQNVNNQYNQTNNRQLYGSVVKVPAGTKFDVTFDSGISSGSLDTNDRLTVRLTNDLTYNGQIIAPAGSLVYGTATDAQNAGYAYGSGAIELNFNQILTPDGNMLNISTQRIVLKAKSERAVKMTRDVVVGALGSMLIGAAFTALGGGGDWGKNMLVYGGIGALGGGVRGAMQRGEDINIPDGTTITITLADSLNAVPYNNLEY